MRKKRFRSSKPFPVALFKAAYAEPGLGVWYVYVLQATEVPLGKRVGYTYVGATNNPSRRLRQHNRELPGGARFTAKWGPWVARALYGPYKCRRDALRAEYALKHSKRGENRWQWSVGDSKWCCGLGANHPWVLCGGMEWL